MEENKLKQFSQNLSLLKMESNNLLNSTKPVLSNSLLSSSSFTQTKTESLLTSFNLKKKLDTDTNSLLLESKKPKISLLATVSLAQNNSAKLNLTTQSTSLKTASFSSYLNSTSSHLKTTLTNLTNLKYKDTASSLNSTTISLPLTNSLLNGNKNTDHKPVETKFELAKTTLKRMHSDDELKENALLDEFIQIDSLINSLHRDTKRLKKFQQTTLIQNPISVDKTTSLQRFKTILINSVSSSLLRQPNFKNFSDKTRANILEYANLVADKDPEFVLKLALYTRRELNIRVTANFLISLASFKPECRPYLHKYFKSSIMLPSDWIDIAEQYQLFMDKKINFGSLPSALRKCMVEKFSDFDAYQLAKYNKEKSRLAKNNSLREVKHVKSKLKDEQGNEGEKTEDKYIKTLKEGLKEKDRILITMNVKSECDSIKLDIIRRDQQANENTKSKSKGKGKPTKVQSQTSQEMDETVAVRFTLDYELKRIMLKSCIKKVWDKRSDCVYPTNFTFARSLVEDQFYIDIEETHFRLGLIINDSKNKNKEISLCTYPHTRHKCELNKLNIIRMSGCGIKLKELKIENSKEQSNLNHQMSNEEESEQEIKQRSYTLKQLIRQLHIAKPVVNVMSLLGKKYPESFEEFMQLRLEGEYDSSRAGKRMKLPVPETWETQISMCGNKAEVWQRLIDNKKLPYMAMLRNLRNMIKAGISEKHHVWVIKKLQDEGAVINSKQFPFRFFTAYEVLDDLVDEYKKFLSGDTTSQTRPGKKTKKEKIPNEIKYDEEVVKRYKTALDNALKVATRYNVSPIKGSTAIFLNLGSEMLTNVSGSARSLGKKVTTIADIASLMGLMLKYACEYSRLNVYRGSSIHKDIQLKQGTILDNMKSLNELSQIGSSRGMSVYPKETFLEVLQEREYFDNLVVIGNGIGDVEFHKSFLRKYRSSVNKDLLFVCINLAVSECGLMENLDFTHENDVCISGYSDSVLRFIAERGGNGQLIHIDKIDKSYELPELKLHQNSEKKLASLPPKPSSPKLPKQIVSQWKTIKVFISSTFRDMHSERDILTRTVFPLLRSKLASYLINIHEIDMRWGITEHESNTNETLSICLNQIEQSDYFIGVLGERYGMVLDEYKTNIDWVQSYQSGASITELEFAAQLRKCQKNSTDLEKTFFYFRNNKSFIDSVPDELRDHFEDDSTLRLDKLKDRVRSKPFEVFNNYQAKWYKLDENSRALLTGLEEFAERVFTNLYNSILKHYCQEVSEHKQSELTLTNNAYIEAYASLFTARVKLISKLDKLLQETTQVVQNTAASTDSSKQLIAKQNSIVNVCLCLSDAGSGKTTFLCYYYTNYLVKLNQFCFAYSVGSFESSELALTFLKCFCIHLLQYYKIFTIQDFEPTSNDFNYFKKVFASLLEQFETSEHSKSEKFYILVDGVDMFVNENGERDDSFNWLPNVIPSSCAFIFSARQTSSTRAVLDRIAASNKETNLIKLNLFEIQQLDVLDKSEIVKSKLEKYNKKLDESAFNNQMKLLTGKRDANNPLYLAIACEELRVHNQFETLTSKLKEIPVRTNLLINYALERLESEYGTRFVTALFMFISCSRDGLLEQELYDMIELYFSFKSDELNRLNSGESLLEFEYLNEVFQTKKRISTSKYLSLLQTLSETFLKPRSAKNGLISLKAHSLIENAVRLKYSDKSSAALASNLTVQIANKLMALYYWHLIDVNFSCEWNLTSQQAYINLPYHLSYAEAYTDLSNILCDLKFIANKSELGLASLLMHDFDLNQSYIEKNVLNLKKKKIYLNKTLPIGLKRFIEYKEFIMSNFHILASNASLIYQQAVNQDDESSPARDVYEILRSESEINGCLFEWKNKKQHSNEKTIKPTSLTDFNDSVCSVCINKSGDLIACGTENCEIKLFALSTANLIRVMQGHSGRINQLCFVNNSTLVSVSSDGIASIWSVNGGYRIKVINNHNGHVVSGCTAEYTGRQFITCGWDCNVKIWDSNEGKLLGELKGHPKPVNSVVFNPDGFTVATGGWDAAIRIFNVVNRNRIAVLRSHKTSIRSISYSLDGVFIASASIDGDVKLWNSKTGSNIATLKGHSLPVNSIKFSPNNQFLITGSSDRRVRVWSGSVGKIVRIIRDKNPITSVCFNPKNGDFIAAGHHDGRVKIYETHTGCLKLNIHVHDKPVSKVKYSSCGSYLVCSSEDGSVKIADIAQLNGKIISELKGNTKAVNTFAINKNNIIVTGSEDCLTNIYDGVWLSNYRVSTNEGDDDDVADLFGEPVKNNLKPKQKSVFDKNLYPNKTLNVHKSGITSCAFNSTGDKFATASKDANIIIFSLDEYSLDAQELHNISSAHLDWITDLSWSNSSDFILTSSNDFSLKLWNAETGIETSQLVGHKANINSCSFQYGCGVSASSDGLVKVWSHKGFEVASLTGHQKRVNSCDLYFEIKVEEESVDETEKSWAEKVDESEWSEAHAKEQLVKKNIVVQHVYLVTGSDDCSIRIWKPNESDFIKSLENHNSKINSVDLSGTDMVATASSDQTVNVYNMKEFFTEYTSGQFVNSECLVRNHNSEVTSIAFTKSSFMFSSSRDGLFLIWKCQNDFNDVLRSIEFVQELQAHNKSLNKILVLKEKLLDKRQSVQFATCSDDKLTKIWSLTEYEDQTVQVELVKTIKQSAPVIYMFSYKLSDRESYLACLMSDSFRLVLLVYDANKNYIPVNNKGFQILDFAGIVQHVKNTQSYLYITLVHDQIYKLPLSEIFSKRNMYNFRYQDETLSKERILSGASTSGNNSNWYSGVDEQDTTTYTVDSKGGLYVSSSQNVLKFTKQIHNNRVTEMFKYRIANGSNRFITASQDCTVKIWNNNFEHQLGQYNTYAAITTIELKEAHNSKYSFVFGDQFGNLHLVVWHDNYN